MFGGTGSTSSKDGLEDRSIETINDPKNSEEISGEKGSFNGSHAATEEKKGLGKASSLLASAKNSLHFNHHNLNSGSLRNHSDQNTQTPLQKLGKEDTALSVPQGEHNNSAGESHPGLRSTFTVGVWEDRNKKCRRTMEDTHAFLYNFLHTPAPNLETKELGLKDNPTDNNKPEQENPALEATNLSSEIMETDNGYFAIFDGHAGTFAADWCGKKLHIILEEMIRTNPNIPIPELLDQTFTSVDAQLEKLPLKNSGCTAVTAILRWEDRIPNSQSATGSIAIGPATIAALKAIDPPNNIDEKPTDDGCNAKKISPTHTNGSSSNSEDTHIKLKSAASRHRVLYTANVGDARIILCRKGKALRLSYDHKGSDENEGKRVASAGGLILNNRVNGVLAVTRALGDNYMKDLVTGHPYTTETVIQPDMDEFIILACDGLWDVCSDQEAVNLIREIEDPTLAAKRLVDYALARFSTDNLSCMIVRFNKSAHLMATTEPDYAIGVEGDPTCMPGKISEAEKIVGDARRKVIEDGVPGIGISGSNFGNGHDSKLTTLNGEENEKRNYQVVQEPGSNEISDGLGIENVGDIKSLTHAGQIC